MRDLLSAALRYAARGWHVFPVGADKKPLAGSHGWHDGSTDPDKIEGMRWQEASGIAIATGPSRLMIVDVDPPEGEQNLDRLVLEHGQLPVTFTARTPRGGLHYYFLRDSEIPESTGKIGPNLDIKASTGYVVAPGSVNSEGKEYSIVVDEDPAPAPGWLVARALNGNGQKHTLSRNGSSTDGAIPDGQRHARLLALAGAMRRQGASASAIEAALVAENVARCRPPEDVEKVRELARDVHARYEPAAAATTPHAETRETKIEVIDATALLAEPEEERSSLFRERFYYPAFGASCGAPRSGKGTTLLWIAFCLATGRDLGDGVECVKRAPAVFFTNEDTRRRLRSRLRAMAIGAAIPFGDIRDLHLIAKPKPALHLPENLEAFKRALDPIGPKFIVIDGLSRISTGRDLNVDTEMQPVVEAIEGIRDHYCAEVELIAHTTKAAGGSGLYKVKGAGCVPAAADHLLLFEREEKHAKLTFSDSRDDEDWGMIFTEQPNMEDDGGITYDLVAKAPDISSIMKQSEKSKKPTTRQRFVEEVIRIHAEKRAGVSKELLAGVLELSEDSIYRHGRVLTELGLIRTVEGGGTEKTLYYPPEVKG